MKKIYLLSLGILLLVNADAWAFYQEANVSAVPAGGGKVYVNNEPASTDNCTSSSSIKNIRLQDNHATGTMYAYAKANADFRFLGWKEENSEEAAYVSTEADGYSFTVFSSDQTSNTTKYYYLYAFFERFGLRLNDSQSSEDIDALLTETDGKVIEEITITRPVYRNNYYNTLCLPFSMTAAQISASPLAGAEIKSFVGASVVSGELNISLRNVNTIEAGKPYFVRYGSADALDKMDFTNVTISAAAPQAVTFNGVTLQGTYVPFAMDTQAALDYNGGYLFLGQNDQLYWPGTAGSIKPFRAYFYVNAATSDLPVRRGMPATFNETNEATGVDDVQGGDVQGIKIMENGILHIIRNGVRFNVQGQIVK